MSDIFENLFIFEMANNHQGSIEHGLKIIEAMGKIKQKHNIKAAIKFQYRNLDTFIHPEYKTRTDVQHIPRFMNTRLEPDQFQTLLDAVRQNNMLVMVTPFDEPSVKMCIDQNVDILKVASSSVSDWPLLESIVDTGKPIIVSTGGASITDIDKIVSFFSHRHAQFAVLHCVSIYPTPNSALQMNMVNRIKLRYPDIPVGYSGHEDPDNFDAVQVAVALGAKILERHVGVSSETVKLNKYSMTPEQADTWVGSAMAAREILGNPLEKIILPAETESLLSLQRGVYARRNIKRGELIGSRDAYFAMPCNAGQTTSGEFGQYRTEWIASQDYSANSPIYEHQSQEDPIRELRSLIHEAKGLLREARITLGKTFEIELSHHYGMSKFRKYGAIIISIVNREYCKKLVIVLPGQLHPNHRHQVKEETFHLLWGDLSLNLNGTLHEMAPGGLQLIERGDWHSFSSKNGAIIEEISTTHVIGDSEYEDPIISHKDLIERKTLLEEW